MRDCYSRTNVFINETGNTKHKKRKHSRSLVFQRMGTQKTLTKSTGQKQPSRGVLWKRFSENKQQFYRRTPMRKCNFKKVASQLS